MRSNDFALIDKSIRRSSRISIQMYIIVYLYTLAQKVIVWLITLTFVGVCCAEEEYGSSTSESDEDEAGVTIVHCRSIDRESQSTNSEEVVKKELCISANVLRQSGIITLGATYSGISFMMPLSLSKLRGILLLSCLSFNPSILL